MILDLSSGAKAQPGMSVGWPIQSWTAFTAAGIPSYPGEATLSGTGVDQATLVGIGVDQATLAALGVQKSTLSASGVQQSTLSSSGAQKSTFTKRTQ